MAELPPPPPKPLKAKKAKQAAAVAARPPKTLKTPALIRPTTRPRLPRSGDTEESPESESDEKPTEVTAEADEPESTTDEPEVTAEEEAPDTGEPESTNGKLGNHRPSGKTSPRRRRRLRGGVAVED